ncbi:MAG: hypothetical protein RBT65_06165 [Methanolobus sp.]|jgi:hypothetical protein|nr:hypothetical protein [Methanolobus sp.]
MNEKIKISAMFMALLVVSLAFVPAASVKAEIGWYEQMLESEGVKVNDFDVKIISYEKIDNDTYYNGKFNIDVEKELGNNIKTLGIVN